MTTRRQFVFATGAAIAAPLVVSGCSLGARIDSYVEAVERTWRAAEHTVSSRSSLQRELVRYATLAPSSHNTQCWKFALEDRRISIVPDYSRRCPVVDPDDHHLFVSLGCAAENLIQAARAHGLSGEATFAVAPTEAVHISLEPATAVDTHLFAAIPQRQSTRSEFDSQPVSNEDLKLLEQAGTGDGIALLLLTDEMAMEQVLEYVVRGNTTQLNDPAFLQELEAWIRFSDTEAVATGDGLLSRASGNPSVPRWIGRLLFSALFTTKGENDKYASHIRSSAGIAIFVSEADNKAHWVEAGRCYERFALQATALGIRNAFLNQPVEVAHLRPQLANHLGVGNRRPDLVVRFGRGPEMPRSLRRPVEAVIL